MFRWWGRFVHRRRVPVLVLSAVLLAISIYIALGGGDLRGGGPTRADSESANAQALFTAEVPQPTAGGSSFELILSSRALAATDPAFRTAAQSMLAPLGADSRVTSVTTPWTATSEAASRALVSRDGHSVLAVIGLRDRAVDAQKYFDSVRAEVARGPLDVQATGFVAINRAFNATLQSDLERAEYVSLPVSLVLLLLIFGAVVAAALPLGVGVLAILGGVAGTLLLSRVTDVSQYALNVVTLIGLGVAIDYSLFVVNRFRDELARGLSREDAVAETMATAGRAITFSGVTVAVGLSGMLFFRGTFLASMGAAGAIVVAIAVFYGITFLPALLSLLGPRVDRLHLRSAGLSFGWGSGFWRGLAGRVMRHPLPVLVPTLVALLAAGIPFLHLRLANGDVDMLPTHLEARAGYDRLLTEFPGQDQTQLLVVVDYGTGSAIQPDRVGALYDLSRSFARLPGVLRVGSIVDADPSLDRAQYVSLYSQPPAAWPPPIQQLAHLSTGGHVAALTVYTNVAPESDAARDLLARLRATAAPPGSRLLVGGQTAADVDVIRYIESRAPAAVAYVVLVTYLVLFLLTGSVVLPLKAILTNFLSIAASFGALVWVFQDGHLAGLLGFTPQSIDPTTPVLLFSIVFGLSMDYEVLLVSRIHEEYVRTGDNRRSVAEGLERSGRLITGAAAIMVAVFLAFGLAEVVIIKSIGIGLALAIAIDATLVRALVVPAVMRLLGRWNWWAPPVLRRLHAAAGLGE